MKDLVKFLAINVVEDTQKVNVRSEVENEKIRFFLRVSDKDIGKIIGKKGRTAKSIRILLTALGKVEKKKIFLDIVEPEKNSTLEACDKI